MGQGFFVTGTDTGIGKTLVAAALLRRWRELGWRVGAMKPVASGCRPTPEGLRNADAESLRAECTLPLPYARINTYAFEPPIAPHIAAAEAGEEIRLAPLVERCRQLSSECDRFVVEGVGGWCVPLGDALTTVDLARELACPVIVVVGLRLGCLNHALLTVESIRHCGLTMAGWVANTADPACERQAALVATLERRWGCAPLGRIPWLEDPSSQHAAVHLSNLP
ncbi:MAG: dethiobiotin synthase [Proteobacteria bacterium]|nr:MAG: dethiobiotin synthase [Pseudomonadota bacterium]QKK11136.1 MAG: dethiobiotin synthase [Pseudomonadota bacterium]